MPIPSSAARRTRAAADPSAAQPPDLFSGGGYADPLASGADTNATSSGNTGQGNGQNSNGRDAGGNLGFEVRGFATDPKHSGYQILTNYESTYWRAAVGVQAWSLYEVLRSFCHNGNNTCYPSINYLLEVLGIKQRRVLTGWSTEVKGKQYHYPGLIETLQHGGLVIAEVVGEGPMLRYLFHVNLTPDLLRPEQVAELPALLQSKHAEMLQAHFAEMAEIASRRRPAKNANPAHAANTPPPMPSTPPPQHESTQFNAPPPLPLQEEEDSTTNMVENGGMTNCQTGVTICHTGGDNLSHKQHQYNNTQLTTASSTNLINNNSGGLQQELLPNLTEQDNSTDVVVALTNLGLAENVVQRLTTRFNRQRILEKIDYLAYLERYHPTKVKNPRGWLRRAIEENYGAPDGYLTAAERAAQPDSAAIDPNFDDVPRVRYSSFEVRDDGPRADANGYGDESFGREVSGDEESENRSAYGETHFGDALYGDAFSGDAARATAEREYLTATRRELVRRHHAPPAETVAFWELVQRDVHATLPADDYALIAEALPLWMDDKHVAVAIWDRSHYRALLHPNRVKLFERNMATLTRRKISLVCEFWDEEGQVVPPGTPPP